VSGAAIRRAEIADAPALALLRRRFGLYRRCGFRRTGEVLELPVAAG
jgi:hypothetical protein